MRHLTTIGSLRAMRNLERSSRLPVRFIGAALASFVAPSADQTQSDPPGDDLVNAAHAMLDDFSTEGVPYIHTTTVSPSVQAFQTAWNADPASWISQLDPDGAYGQNVHDALDSIGSYVGITDAPDVNPNPGFAPWTGGGVPSADTTTPGVLNIPQITITPGPSPQTTGPSPQTSAPVSSHPIMQAHASGGASLWPWALALIAAGGAAYLVERHRKRGHRHPSNKSVLVFR